MEHGDFLELFYSNLRNELGEDKIVKSVEDLISKNKFSKKSFMNLLEEVYYE